MYRLNRTPEYLARLKAALHYDPETGHCTWLTQRSGVRAGKRAGTLHPEGYELIRFERLGFFAHQFAWFFMTGEWPAIDVDHKNAQRSDNRWENLRLATRPQNQFNRVRVARGHSAFKGVGLLKGKWAAYIGRRYIGRFETEVEAARAYDRAALARDPEFARINFPHSDYDQAAS